MCQSDLRPLPIDLSWNLWDYMGVEHKATDMFISWSVAPKSNPEDREFFTSEHHAVDVAFDWSADCHGDAMIVFRDDVEWMEIVA
jgi:hypothetical protein